MKKIITTLAVMALTGCAYMSTQQNHETTDAAGVLTKTTTSTRTYSVFAANSDVTKLRTTQTDKTQGMSVAAVGQDTPGTNIVQVLNALGGLLQAATAAAK